MSDTHVRCILYINTETQQHPQIRLTEPDAVGCLWDPTDTPWPGQLILNGCGVKCGVDHQDSVISKTQTHMEVNKRQTKTHEKSQKYNSKDVKCPAVLNKQWTGTRERLEMQYEDDGNLERRQTLNMEEKENIKGEMEMLKGGRTEHSRNDGKAEEKTFNSKHSRDGGRRLDSS